MPDMDVLLWIFLIVLFFMLINTRSEVRNLQRQLDHTLVKKILGQTSSPNEVKDVPLDKPKDIIAEKQVVIPVKSIVEPVSAPSFDQTQNNMSFLGQKMITWIAGFAAVLGFFYFVRYSIENGLLTPAARLFTAAFFGGLSIIAGCWLHGRKQTANHLQISEVLIGIGIAAWYFASYALSKIYALAPDYVSISLMIAVTAVSVILTLYYGGKTTAVLAMIGGFLTPSLSAGYCGSFLFSLYMFVFVSALLWMSRKLALFWLAVLSFVGMYFWVGLYMFLYFVPADTLNLFILMIATICVSLLFGRGNSGHKNELSFEIINCILAAFFAFVFLFNTSFGVQEWILIAILLAGLNVLAIVCKDAYFKLFAAMNLMIYGLLYFFVEESFEPVLIYAMFAAVTLLPMYIVSWFKKCRDFILFSPVAAPFVYAVAYMVLPMSDILPYIGLATAFLLSARILPLNIKDKKDNDIVGIIILCSTALIAFASASLLEFKLWTPVLAVGTLVLAVLKSKLKIFYLEKGIIVAIITFVLLKIKLVFSALNLLFLSSSIKFYIKDLTPEFYVTDILIPVVAFAGIGFILQREKLGRAIFSLGGLLGLYGLFSLFMLLNAKTGGFSPVIWSDRPDTIPLTMLLLSGGLIFLSENKNYLLAKVSFYIGLWRLIYFYLAIPISDVSYFQIAAMYGYPMLLFMVLAWKGRQNLRDWFALGAAAMSFVFVSALMTYGFYGTLYLNSIEFTNSSIFAYSAAWLLLGIVWLVFAFRRRILVKPAFGLIYLVIAKVFLYDVASLGGIWRIGALFGLAGALLSISYFYTRFFVIKKETKV